MLRARPSARRPGPAPRAPSRARGPRIRSLPDSSLRVARGSGGLLSRRRLCSGRSDDRQLRPTVVIAFIIAEHHRVRRLHHAREERSEQIGLFVDQRFASGVGELILVGHRERTGRARLDTQSAKYAAQIVDLINAAISFARAEAFVVGVLGTFDVDRIRGARPGAQFAADALLQAVRPPVELVTTMEAWCGRLLFERVLLGDGLAKHRAERDTESGDPIPERLSNGVRHLTPPFGRAPRRPSARASAAQGSRRQRHRTRPARARVLFSFLEAGTTPRAARQPRPPPS